MTILFATEANNSVRSGSCKKDGPVKQFFFSAKYLENSKLHLIIVFDAGRVGVVGGGGGGGGGGHYISCCDN